MQNINDLHREDLISSLTHKKTKREKPNIRKTLMVQKQNNNDDSLLKKPTNCLKDKDRLDKKNQKLNDKNA